MKFCITFCITFCIACGAASPQAAVDQAAGQSSQGAQGEQGPKGDKGDPGKDGKDGAQGPKGDKGDTGAAGADGAAGAAGKDGAPGVQGATGATGAIGAAGAVGPQGLQGAAGASGNLVTVVDNLGNVIGDLWSADAFSNYTVSNGNHRFTLNNTGYLASLTIYYATAGCSGEARVVQQTASFVNTFADSGDATGQTIDAFIGTEKMDSFAYASRRMNGSCAAGTGHVVGSFNIQAVTLPFTVPVTNPQLPN